MLLVSYRCTHHNGSRGPLSSLSRGLPGDDISDVVDGERRQRVLAGVESERRRPRHDQHHLHVGRLALVELEEQVQTGLTS